MGDSYGQEVSHLGTFPRRRVKGGKSNPVFQMPRMHLSNNHISGPLIWGRVPAVLNPSGPLPFPPQAVKGGEYWVQPRKPTGDQQAQEGRPSLSLKWHFLFFNFCPCFAVCGILVLRLVIEPILPCFGSSES